MKSTTQQRNVIFAAIFIGGMLILFCALALQLGSQNLNGIIVDSSGNPIADVNVYAVRVAESNRFRVDGVGTRYEVIDQDVFSTDKEGRYSGELSYGQSLQTDMFLFACKKGYLPLHLNHTDQRKGPAIMHRVDEPREVSRESRAYSTGWQAVHAQCGN